MRNSIISEPAIEIPNRQYIVNEPIIENDITVLRVPVVRTGDLSGISEVNIMSKDGSAEAGRDYNGFHKGMNRIIIFYCYVLFLQNLLFEVQKCLIHI